ncbi:PREDICTED: bromodomain-containing protein 8-like isoform X2 [Acropora digitifera]|uniref:bromodomain-containing protein 8-like isoform X2 n=1 Tax=Acropora digitifera TaxID=70779 RepID=UPI00077A35ED|nr:PREDICTED: bromodomain-containing protein 8-like isoform X2 [Acropora digitifera]
MAASMLGQKHKLPPGQNPEEWTIREKLTLASSVVRSGDQNWVSVSRTIKPILETGCCAIQRPPDFFSQKNCASHYSEMLEKVNTPKRKRTSEGGGTETPGDLIVRKLTIERMEELRKSIKSDQQSYKKLKERIEDIRSGKLDHQLPALVEDIKLRKKMKPLPIPQQESEGPVPPITPTTPTPLLTPTTHSGSQQIVQPDVPKPPGSQPLSSPQKGKQLRVPKPTPRFQKYQQQLQQRNSSHSSQFSPSSQPTDGPVTSSEQSSGDGVHGGSAAGGLGQTGAFLSSTPPMDVDLGGVVPLSFHGDMAPPQISPRKTDSIPQLSARQQGTSQASLPSKQGSTESTLVSLLSQPPSKDEKLSRRPSGTEQEMSSIKVNITNEQEHRSSVSSQSSQVASPKHSPLSTTLQQTPSIQNSDGKHFLGVTPSMEPKILDSMSMRERQGNIPQVVATGAAPSVTAPTLSKLLASENSIATSSPSPISAAASIGGAVAQASVVESGVIESASADGPIPVINREAIEGGEAVLSVSTPMPGISVHPKAAALVATLPSPMAITPPPTTPPADRKEIVTPKFEPAVKNTEKTTVPEATQDADENEASPARQNTDRPVAIPEVKVETVDTPVSSPRVSKRAAKPGRPGRPPKAGRRNQRNRSKSTDNEGDTEEDHEEEPKFEQVDVESEKADEEDEEEIDSTAEDKKDYSEEEIERESGEEAVSDFGERSQSEKDEQEPGTSMKEFLMDRAGIGGTESVPGSPASQVSQGSDEQEAIQAQKTWKKSIMLVWRAAANHKYANVFLHPVTDDEAPGYHSVVFRPMDLSTIKKNIENGTIRTTSEFQRDMMLMFQNALMYNSADHDVYRMAEEMRDDVMEQIQSYIATQIMVDSKMLRGHRQDGMLRIATRYTLEAHQGKRTRYT